MDRNDPELKSASIWGLNTHTHTIYCGKWFIMRGRRNCHILIVEIENFTSWVLDLLLEIKNGMLLKT